LPWSTSKARHFSWEGRGVLQQPGAKSGRKRLVAEELAAPAGRYKSHEQGKE